MLTTAKKKRPANIILRRPPFIAATTADWHLVDNTLTGIIRDGTIVMDAATRHTT